MNDVPAAPPPSGTRVPREVAFRLFSKEFNASTVTLQEDREKAPRYVLTPLGARVNRVMLVGILSERVNTGDDDEPMWKARLTDPVGTFHILSGKFQPQATGILTSISTIPAYVAVIGKVRAYSPEEGVVYLSVRPERLSLVDRETYCYWMLETVRHTKARLDAMEECMSLTDPTVDMLVRLGHSRRTAVDVLEAMRRYPNVDTSYYHMMLKDALQVIMSVAGGLAPVEVAATRPTPPSGEERDVPRGVAGEAEREGAPAADDGTDTGEEDIEPGPESTSIVERVLTIIVREGKKHRMGVPLAELVTLCSEEGISRGELDVSLNELLECGEIYQPTEDTYRGLS